MSQLDVIGVVRKHRWASLDVQRMRLEEDGCGPIIDLDATPRDWLLTAIRERTIIKAPFAFLLTKRKGVRAGLADFEAFTGKLAKVRRKDGTTCIGVVKDLDTGLLADTPGARKAMLAVVREQLMRSVRGYGIAEGVRRGPKPLTLTALQEAKAEAIWRNVRKYPRWEDVEPALQQVHEDLTRWAAYRKWKARTIGKKQD
jgi:hypothetical protein